MEELCDFFPAQNRRQRTGPFRIGSVGKVPGSAQRLDVKESQCCQTLRYRARRFSFPKQLRLIFANVSRTQAIRGTVEASSKIFDCANVVTYGILCVIAKLSFRAVRPAKPHEKPHEAATSFQWVSLFFRACPLGPSGPRNLMKNHTRRPRLFNGLACFFEPGVRPASFCEGGSREHLL